MSQSAREQLISVVEQFGVAMVLDALAEVSEEVAEEIESEDNEANEERVRAHNDVASKLRSLVRCYSKELAEVTESEEKSEEEDQIDDAMNGRR